MKYCWLINDGKGQFRSDWWSFSYEETRMYVREGNISTRFSINAMTQEQLKDALDDLLTDLVGTRARVLYPKKYRSVEYLQKVGVALFEATDKMDEKQKKEKNAS